MRGTSLSGALAFPSTGYLRLGAIVRKVLPLLLLAGLVPVSRGDAADNSETTGKRLTQVSLEQLGEIEVTTASKVPVKAIRTPAAI